MTRRGASKAYANFSAGLVTEANQLSYPENAAIAMDNIDLNEDGSAQRRAGLKFDGVIANPIPVISSPIAVTATTVHKWSAVNGDPSVNIAVIQIANRLEFYYVRDGEMLSNCAVSTVNGVTADHLLLTDTEYPSDSTALLRDQTPLSTASGGGRLYVVGKYNDPFVIEFTAPETKWDKGSIETTTLSLKIRDFEIAEEGETFTDSMDAEFSLSGVKRQAFMSGAHMYNLGNQGWPSEELEGTVIIGDENQLRVADTTCITSTSNDPDSFSKDNKAAEYTWDTVDFFPTTQDLFHTYQAGSGSTISSQVSYSPWLLENDYVGTTPSPRGRFIKEAFFIRRAGIGNFGAFTASHPYILHEEFYEVVKAATRPTTVAFYAGRVWYTGLEGNNFSSNIYFSQIIGNTLKKAEKCYQEADPTAEEIHDLVATDGGFIGLEEVGKILKIAPIGPSLVVIADNGVWTISGDGDLSSFKADAFSIRKVSDQGAVSEGAIVIAKDVIYIWGNTSIIGVLTGPQGGVISQDISSDKIKSLYQQIVGESKESAFSIFDEGSNKIFWFYAEDLDVSFTSLKGKAFNKVLYWDISLGAFGKHSLEIQTDILPVATINANLLNLTDIEDPVTVTNGGQVQVTVDSDPLFTTTSVFTSEKSSIKILTLTGNSIDGYEYRFSDFSDITTFADWDNDHSSFLEGGFDSLGDILGKAKKAPLIQSHFERTEDGYTTDPINNELLLKNPSSCLVSYGWDWENSPYSNQFQAYKLLRNYTPVNEADDFNYDQTVVSTRNRIRGRGMSLGLRFESETGKDFRLLGYGILYTTRGRP